MAAMKERLLAKQQPLAWSLKLIRSAVATPALAAVGAGIVLIGHEHGLSAGRVCT